MSVLQEIHDRLVNLESQLNDRPTEANEVRAIRQLLDGDEAEWIGTVAAQRLLGVQSVNTVKAWAQRGWLRSKQLPNGRLKVSLEDVLERRDTDRALSAMGSYDGPITDEILTQMRGPASPEVEAIVTEIVALAEARLRETKQGNGE